MRRWFSNTIKDLIVITKHLVPVSPYFNDTIIFKAGNLNENFRKFYLWCVWACSVVSNSLWTLWTGSSVHGILQARILEWVATSRVSSRPRRSKPCFLQWQANSLPVVPAGKLLAWGHPAKMELPCLGVKKKKFSLESHISLLHGCVLYWSILGKITLLLEVKFSQYTYNDWFLLLENTLQNIVTKFKHLGTEIVIAYREESIINQKSGYLDISSSFSSDLWSKCWIYLELVVLVYTMKVKVLVS